MTVRFEREILPLHETASGARYEIDVWRYTHPDATQVLYLQGGVHGVELTGVPVLYEFMQQVEAEQLPVSFICVPMANPMGLDSQIMGQQVGYNNLHTNQQNCWNWNRVGNLRNEGSIEGRWIKTLLDLAEPATTVLDFHTAGLETAPHVYAHVSQVHHAEPLGFPHVLAWETPSDSFSDSCFKRGQVALTFELSESRVAPEEGVERGLRALRIFLGLEEAAAPGTVWVIKEQLLKWYAPESGVLQWKVRAGETVVEGQPLARLYRREGVQELLSPIEGVLLLKNPIHAPHQHQELAKFLKT